MASRDLQLQLLLRLNDQMSRGLHTALQTVQRDSQATTRSLNTISEATNRIRPQGIERLSASLRTMQGHARSALATLSQIARTGAMAGGAVLAGGYVIKAAAKAPMAYDRRLALLSNTANSGMDAAGRIAAKDNLNAGIKHAVKTGGGTPEQALDALNTLVGSGAFGNANQSMALLPMVQKFATGTGATGDDLSKILIAAKQNMGIADADMPAMLSKAIRAGQEGGFELSDMSKWLPQQMALAATNGMKGIPGFESLLAANQVSRITAGTTDEAGNNVVNLLAKINSQDTAKDFKKQGIDLTGSLAAARGKGQNTLEAFVGLVEKIAATDKDYVKLRKKADGETGADKKATLSAMADILQQKSIGKAVQDRQALMELLALIQQKEKYQDVKGKVNAEKGTEGDTSYNTVASTLDYKTEQLGNQKAFAAIDLLGQIDEPLGRLLDKVNELAEANPKLTIATEAATVALGALAVGAGSSALMNAVTGGGGGASLLSRGAPLLGKAGLVGLAGIAGYGAGSWLSEKMPDQLKDYIGQNIAKDLAFFDNKEAQQSLNINLSIDGKEIANHVNSINGKEARRN